MSWLWTLIVGVVIGAIAGTITSKGNSMSCVTSIITGLVGSSVGQVVFGEWGPKATGMALTPPILGAVVLAAVVSFFFGKRPQIFIR